MTGPSRVALVGTGLIGGSIGLALRRLGWEVRGFDHDATRGARAKEAGAVDSLAASVREAVDGTDLTIVAVPVGQVAAMVVEALDAGSRLVTDVGSVKGPVVAAVEVARPDLAPRFIGGHPMAGSEQEGLDGASADLFVGATWVLTPTEHTDPEAFAEVRAIAADLGAEAVAVPPELHDSLVAVVSHVPQLAASTLMNVADASGDRHAVLLRLAAGGFRDMTRIASGHPAIWPDICVANRDAIVTALDEYLASLMRVRAMVASGDRDALLGELQSARVARRNLPTGLPADEQLVEFRIPIEDRPGALAHVLTLATELGVNVADLEIAHSLEGRSGVLVLVVSNDADGFEDALVGHGYHAGSVIAVVSIPNELSISGPAPLRGRLRVPGDKGISHRALLFAAMATGRSRAVGLAGGDDVARTRLLLRDLGVDVTSAGSAITVVGRGVDGMLEPDRVLDCGNSGTTMRTTAGLLAGRPFLSVLSGDESLVQRPMGRVVEPLRGMGAQIDGRAGGTLAPLAMRGGGLHGRAHRTSVASAQVKTALVLAGLQADGTTEITEPAPSRDHTERMLRALGAPVTVDGRTVRVTAGAPSPFELLVPGDPSSAAFWVVGATITPGSDLVIEGVACNPTRVAFVDVLRRMGAAVEIDITGHELGEPVGDLHVSASALHGTTIAGDEIPLVQDELPVLAVAAAFAEGITEISDAGELRVKESDRIATVEALLAGLGVGVETAADALSIRGGRPRAARLASHEDHRLAMAAAIAANAIEGESVIEGWTAISVSYPEFADDLMTVTGRS